MGVERGEKKKRNKVSRLVSLRRDEEKRIELGRREKFLSRPRKKFSNYIFNFERNWRCRDEGKKYSSLNCAFFSFENISFGRVFFSILENYEYLVIQEEDFGSKWWGYRYRCPCSRGDVCWTSAGTWNSWRRRGRIRSWRTKIQRLAIGNPRPAPPDSRGPFRRRWTRPSLYRKTKSCSENSKRLE